MWHRSDVDCVVIWEKIGNGMDEQNMSEDAMVELFEPMGKEAVQAWYRAWEFFAKWRGQGSPVSERRFQVGRHT